MAAIVVVACGLQRRDEPGEIAAGGSRVPEAGTNEPRYPGQTYEQQDGQR